MHTHTSLAKILGPDGLDGLLRGKLRALDWILDQDCNATGDLSTCAALLVKDVNLGGDSRGRGRLGSSLRKDG